MLDLLEIMRKMQMLFMHAIRADIMEYGLGKTEIVVLMTVYHERSFRITDLAKIADVPASTFTGVIDRLVQKNFLVRENDPSDRRSVRVRGTPYLQQTIELLMNRINVIMSEMLRPIADELIKRTAENLNSIYATITPQAGYHNEKHGYEV